MSVPVKIAIVTKSSTVAGSKNINSPFATATFLDSLLQGTFHKDTWTLAIVVIGEKRKGR
jgi:hypothetical protein